MILEPTRHYRDMKPMLDRFVADPHLPHSEAHTDHVDDVMFASLKKGFPVATKEEPLPRQWP